MKAVTLTQGKVALVSDEDYERVSQFKWCASNESRGCKWYAVRFEYKNGVKIKIRMHRFILGLSPKPDDGMVVDHINHESLDNRRENLEVITQAENMRRSLGWKRKLVALVDPLAAIDF